STSLLNTLYLVYCRDTYHGTLYRKPRQTSTTMGQGQQTTETGSSGEFAGQRFFAEFARRLEPHVGLRTRYRSANGSTRARVRGGVFPPGQARFGAMQQDPDAFSGFAGSRETPN